MRALSIIPRFVTRLLHIACAGVCGMLLFAAPVLADQHWQDLHDDVKRGELVELPVILDWLQAHYAGEVLEVELERDDGLTLYEVEMLGPQGQVVEFEFNASDGQLIGMEGTNINAMRKSP